MKRRMKAGLLVGILAIVSIIVYFIYTGNFHVHDYTAYFQKLVETHYLFSATVFMTIYAILIACSVPATPPFTLIGGYVFGLIPGFLFSLVACTVGATCSFLVFKYFMRQWLRRWESPKIEHFIKRFREYGASYLLMLHFLSVIPYFFVNIVAALAEVPLKTYVWTLVIGSTPLLFLYSLAARQLATMTSLKDLLSWPVLLVLGLLIFMAFLPILLKRFKISFDI